MAHSRELTMNTKIGSDVFKKNARYFNEFEKMVMVEGVKNNIFRIKGETIIPLRRKNKKLNNSDFAEFIGDKFDFDELFAFNYYGLVKLSTGTIKIVKQNITIFPNLRTIKSRVLHFNSIKTYHIKKLAPDLLSYFPEFKQFLVDLRSF